MRKDRETDVYFFANHGQTEEIAADCVLVASCLGHFIHNQSFANNSIRALTRLCQEHSLIVGIIRQESVIDKLLQLRV